LRSSGPARGAKAGEWQGVPDEVVGSRALGEDFGSLPHESKSHMLYAGLRYHSEPPLYAPIHTEGT